MSDCDKHDIASCPWAFSPARDGWCICESVSAVKVTWDKPGDLGRMSIEAMARDEQVDEQ